MTDKQYQTIFSIYNHLLEEIDIGVHAIDIYGKTIIYNRKMMDIESMNAADVLNKNLLDIFIFKDGQDSTLVKALKEGATSKNIKQTYFNIKGQQITTINNTFPIYLDNKIVAAIEIAKDVTIIERMLKENFQRNNTIFTFENIIAKSKQTISVIEEAKRASRTSSSILIFGETGTGKELFAQSIHNNSNRASKPFVTQNCAALPESLVESLLFGTKKGAFTGSMEHQGLFEEADGGTLLLDEINSLSPHMQAKLLRVLQEKTIRRLGGTHDKKVDIRIIATINEDPLEAIANNRLREDLYYRLSVVTLSIPPLRNRKEDIALLVQHFIDKYNKLFDMQVKGVDKQVIEFFYAYDWPGNIRELEHIIEGTMNIINDEDYISCSNLPMHIQKKINADTLRSSANNELAIQQAETSRHSLQDYLKLNEERYITDLLRKNNFNISVTAKEIGISRQSLQYRLKKLNIDKNTIDPKN